MEALFGDAASSDVDVYVYNGPSTTSTLFPLHKFPLLARSSLFRAYFTAFPDPGAGPASSAALRALFGAKEDFSSLIQPAERGERGTWV